MKTSKLLIAIVAGIVGTVMMDIGNQLGVSASLVTKINLVFIGNLMDSWLHGHFFFSSPKEVPMMENAEIIGGLYHYGIGIVFALLLCMLTMYTRLQRISTMMAAVVFGVLTSAVSLCFVFPSVGLGMLGLHHGSQLLTTSLYNHFFYGLGLGAVFTLAKKWVATQHIANDVKGDA